MENKYDWRVKPCPFCGKEPEVGFTKTYESSCGPDVIEARVHCPICNIEQRVRFSIPMSDKFTSFTDVLDVCTEVVNKWNARYNEDETD